MSPEEKAAMAAMAELKRLKAKRTSLKGAVTRAETFASDCKAATQGELLHRRESIMVILHKLDASPPARACMMACELFHVPVEMVDVNLLGGDHLKSEYLKKNPLHTVPMLEDGSLVIHDSHAILMYLADIYGKDESFYPKDPKQRALVNQKLFFDTSILFPRLRNITYPLIMEGNKIIPQKSLDAIEEAYHFMEEFLSRSKYLSGDNITIADIAAYSTITSLVLLLELNAQKFPKTQAWLKELEKLPYVQKGNPKGVADLKHCIDSHLA